MSTLLWAVALLIAFGGVGYFLLANKQKGPFEIINNLTGFFDEIKTKIDELFLSIKSIAKYLSELQERISGIFDLFQSAEQQRAAVEARIKEHLTEHVNTKIDELKAGLDKQTERIFSGLDLQKQIIVTELTKSLAVAVPFSAPIEQPSIVDDPKPENVEPSTDATAVKTKSKRKK